MTATAPADVYAVRESRVLMAAVSAFLHTEPGWYWAILVAITLAVLVAFWFVRWSIRINGKRELRQIQLGFDRDMFELDYDAWKATRAIEEWAATMEQAIREQPDLVTALLSEGVPLHAREAVA